MSEITLAQRLPKIYSVIVGEPFFENMDFSYVLERDGVLLEETRNSDIVDVLDNIPGDIVNDHLSPDSTYEITPKLFLIQENSESKELKKVYEFDYDGFQWVLLDSFE